MVRRWSEGWNIIKLDSLAEFRNGINFSKENYGVGIKVIGVGDFQSHFYVQYDELTEINPEGVVRDDDLLQENDLLFVRSNGNPQLVGRCLFIKDLPESLTHSGFTIRMRFLDERVFPPFYAQIIRSNLVRSQMIRLSGGTNITNLSQKILGELRLPLPSLEEQRAIADILGTWDEAIALTERLIDALQERKKGLMQKLLTGEVRFPGFDEEWEIKNFEDVFKRVTRKNKVGNDNALTISAQHGLISQQDFFNKRVASKNLEGYYLLKNGEFAYNKSYSDGYPFGAMKRLDDYEAGVLSTLYICFKLMDELNNNDFYAHYFEAGRMNKEIYQIAQEGARNHGLLNMSIGDFFKMNIDLPSPEEQSKVAEFLNTQDEIINIVIQKLNSLQQQKKGLMQQLLTGQVRVKV